MKTILFMAISLDGKTAGEDGDTSWVTDEDVKPMDELMVGCGVMIMGSKTYDSFGDELPNEQALQVVMTKRQDLLDKEQNNVIFTNESPQEVLAMLDKKGFERVMLAGGEELNSSFLKDGLLDEVWVIQKPLILGTGKSLFEVNTKIEMELVEEEKLSGNRRLLKYAKKNDEAQD